MQRADGSWTLRFDLGRDPTGKRKQKLVTFRGTKREAQRELTRILNELNTGAYVEPARLTVADYLRRWLADYAKTNVTAKTYERYAEIAEKHLISALGANPLPKLQPLQIQTYYGQALQSGRRDGKRSLSAQTVLHHHRLLHTALGQAVKGQLIARNPADAVEPPRPVPPEMQVLDEEGAVRLLELASGNRLYLPCLLAIGTGMRLGEILGLRWEDVDLRASSLCVRQSLQQTREGLSFKQPKPAKSRRTVALPSVVEGLIRHQGEQAQLRLSLGPAYQDHGPGRLPRRRPSLAAQAPQQVLRAPGREGGSVGG
jgi:integrase